MIPPSGYTVGVTAITVRDRSCVSGYYGVRERIRVRISVRNRIKRMRVRAGSISIRVGVRVRIRVKMMRVTISRRCIYQKVPLIYIRGWILVIEGTYNI